MEKKEPKATKIWINELQNGEKELRADFDNDRHHGVAIPRPHGTKELARSLNLMAINIMHDPNLNEDQPEEFQ